MTPDGELLTAALGREPLRWEPVETGGYTRSRTCRVETAGGQVFAKQADDQGSLQMLRRESLIYEGTRGSFLPGFVGFADSGERALLAIEFVDGAHWPPPYPTDLAPLEAALEDVAAADPPAELPAAWAWESRWERVAADPQPFLALGLCSPAWLEASVDRLIAAEKEADFKGEHLVHNDLYAANIAFRSGRALFVDWGAAVRGSRWTDVALAHLSVRVESGPPLPTPPDAIPFVAAFAGHFAVEAPAPLPEWADPSSTLRQDMKGDLVHALQWCVEALDLPPLS